MTMAGHLYHLRTRNNFIYYFMRGTAIIKIIIIIDLGEAELSSLICIPATIEVITNLSI